jgi:hypothetical protein
LRAPQSDDSAMSAPRKARGARRASALFANRGSPGGAMRALAAAAVANGALNPGLRMHSGRPTAMRALAAVTDGD